MGLAVLGTLNSSTIRLHSVSPDQRLEIVDPDGEQTVDSERRKFGKEIVIFQQSAGEAVPVVDLRTRKF